MRTAAISRKTLETDIVLSLDLDGGRIEIDTGIGFFDHMLTALAKHGGFGLSVKCVGDLYVDPHHTVEDVGITLGKAFAQISGDRSGIARYGSAYIPMDEALAFAVVDISGRPFLRYEAQMHQQQCGGYDTCLTEEFFRAFAFNAGVTLHLSALYGTNAHHITEALYKAAAHALKAACTQTCGEVLSTKGCL